MNNRKIYDQEGYSHYITFSCCKRRRLLDDEMAMRIVIGILGSQLAKKNGKCAGFVIMPDHVHSIVRFRQQNQLSNFIQQWKRLSSFKLRRKMKNYQLPYVRYLGKSDPIWQPKYYSLNIHSPEKLKEKLEYMHANPVRAGLADTPEAWAFSSARHYLLGKFVGLHIEFPN